MPVQKSFTFYQNAQSAVDWQVTDDSGAVVNNASLVLSIYWGRDKVRPDIVPGLVVASVNALSMVFSNTTNNYTASFTITANSAPIGGDYTVVIDATLSASPLDHWERPAVILSTGL